MTPSNGVLHAPEVSYPSVMVQGITYTIKLTGLTGFLLDSWGVNVGTLGDAMAKPVGRTKLCFQLFAACVGHHFLESGKPVRMPEEWALLIPVAQQKECFDAMALVLFPKPQPVKEAPAPAQVVEMPGPANLQ